MANLCESGNIPEENEWFIRYEMDDAKILLNILFSSIIRKPLIMQQQLIEIRWAVIFQRVIYLYFRVILNLKPKW